MDEIEKMLAQLRENRNQLDEMIEAEEAGSSRWYSLCNAFDGIEDAIYHLEEI